MGSKQNYLNNPLIHQDRRINKKASKWVKSFDCTNMKPLIICRGPIRKEAMDVFASRRELASKAARPMMAARIKFMININLHFPQTNRALTVNEGEKRFQPT